MSSKALVTANQSAVELLHQYNGDKKRMNEIVDELKRIRNDSGKRKGDLGRKVVSAEKDGMALGMGAGIGAGLVAGAAAVAAPFTAGASLAVAAGASTVAGAVTGHMATNRYKANVLKHDHKLDKESAERVTRLLSEFEGQIRPMRKPVKFLKRFYQVHGLNRDVLVRLETRMDDLLGSLDSDSGNVFDMMEQCVRVMRSLEDVMEDVEAEVHFRSDQD